MKIFNTLTRYKEEFVPIEPGKVRMYVCGPTVYNFIHIGNARPMIFFDTVRRYFEYKGYEVNFVSNFTDVDDKIIKAAAEEGVDSSEISERYIKECKKDMAGMNIRPATVHPQATKEIPGMLDMIGELLRTSHAYTAPDGTVYYRVRSFKGYGKLSHKNLDDLQSGFRTLKVTGEEAKEDPNDFVLWKPKKEGEPYWESPWCQGRPGWHIECSVMSKKYLGEQIDIHGGGEDLIFPHHENEIAQSEAVSGKTFANYWMHNAFLNIDTADLMESSKASLDRILTCMEHLRDVLAKAEEKALSAEEEKALEELDALVKKYEDAMDDDFNTADAISAVFEIVKLANSTVNEQSAKQFAAKMNETLEKLLYVLGILTERKQESLDAKVEALIAERQAARKAKDFARADEIRNQLTEMGIILKDTREGVKWQRA